MFETTTLHPFRHPGIRRLSHCDARSPSFAIGNRNISGQQPGARNDFLFGLPWWKDREWAKTYLTEVQKLLWWELWDRWRK